MNRLSNKFLNLKKLCGILMENSTQKHMLYIFFLVQIPQDISINKLRN